MEACMLRSAWKTFSGHGDMHTTLVRKAEDCSNLARAWQSCVPPGFDSPAFCSNLYNVTRFEELSYGSECSELLEVAHRKWRRKGSKTSLQKEVYKILEGSIADPWTTLINTKLDVFGIEYNICEQQWMTFCQGIGQAPQGIRTAIFKTLINSWSTTHQMGESPLLPCFLAVPKKRIISNTTLNVTPSGPLPRVLVASLPPPSPAPPSKGCACSKGLAMDLSF